MPEQNEQFNQNDRALLQKVFESTEKTRKYLFWMRMMSMLKVVILIVSLFIVYAYIVPKLPVILEGYLK